MKRLLKYALGIAVVTLLQACVAGGAYYDGGGAYYGDGDAELTYGADFYEPYGYDYGGWGPRYWVGPPRGDGQRFDRPGGGRPAYRPAEPSRPMPSIPSRQRTR